MREVPLTKGFVALVDDEDFARVSAFKWCAMVMRGSRTVYAMRGERRGGRHRTILLHRFLLNPESGVEVDHINGNGLDNRRENLRLCSRAENSRNHPGSRTRRSRFKGVILNRQGHWKRTKPFNASIRANGKTTSLGCHATEEAAARAYDAAAKRLHGPFARLNFPEVPCGV